MISVAKALVSDAEGNTLVLCRSDTHPSYAHEADLPGGLIEPSESPAAAVIREIMEECGLAVDENKVKLLYTRVTPSGRQDSLYAVTVKGTKPDITISWEHKSYEWVERSKLLVSLQTKDDYMIVVFEYLK